MNNQQWTAENTINSPLMAYSTVPLTQTNLVTEDQITMIGFDLHETLIFTGYTLIGAYQGAFTVSNYSLVSPTPTSDKRPSICTYLHPVISPSCYAHPVITATELPLNPPSVQCTSQLVRAVESISDMGRSFRRMYARLLAMQPKKTQFISVLVLVSMEWANLHAISTVGPEWTSLFSRKSSLSSNQLISTPWVFPVQTQNDETVSMAIPEQWSMTIEHVVQESNRLDRSTVPAIMAIGHASQGKSTFNRLLLNTLFRTYKTVFMLDLDLGQPEVTSPGVLSLIEMDAPILGGPGFLSSVGRQGRIASRYLGHYKGAGADFDTYCTSIYSLMCKYKELGNGKPLVVNTMGWVHGFGMHVLRSCIELIQPVWLIQLHDHVDHDIFHVDENIVSYHTIKCPGIKSIYPELISSQLKLKSNELRTLRILVELMMRSSRETNHAPLPSQDQLLVPSQSSAYAWLSPIPLTHRTYPQYQIRIEDIDLHVQCAASETCEDKMTSVHALNGKLVGIGIREGTEVTYIGLGVIRGVIRRGSGASLELILATRIPIQVLNISSSSNQAAPHRFVLIGGEVELGVGMMTWGLDGDWASLRVPGPYLSARNVYGVGGKGSQSIRRYIMRQNK